jgi:hypothetical protein
MFKKSPKQIDFLSEYKIDDKLAEKGCRKIA